MIGWIDPIDAPRANGCRCLSNPAYGRIVSKRQLLLKLPSYSIKTAQYIKNNITLLLIGVGIILSPGGRKHKDLPI